MKEFILAFIGSVGPAILFNIERKNLAWAGLCGAIGWTAYKGTLTLSSSTLLAVFTAALTISFLSEIMAKILKTPSTVFYIPSLFPIVPGIPAYYTVLNLINGDIELAVSKGLETIGSAGAIAFGILLISTIFRFINTNYSRNIKG